MYVEKIYIYIYEDVEMMIINNKKWKWEEVMESEWGRMKMHGISNRVN